jgi:hypothetical protein
VGKINKIAKQFYEKASKDTEFSADIKKAPSAILGAF